MTRRFRLVTAAIVIVGSGLVGTAHLVAESPEQRRQVEAADRASDRFDRSMNAYVKSTGTRVAAETAKVKTHYSSLLDFVNARLAAAPRVSSRGTSPYGRQHSDGFRNANDRRALMLQPFMALAAYLRDAVVPEQQFVDAGKSLVRISPTKLLDGTSVTTGAPIRDVVIPAFQKARDRLKKHQAPSAAALLQFDLMTYADDALTQAKAGAKKLDAYQPFFFSLGSRPADLLERLTVLEATIASDLANRISALTDG